MGEATLSYKLTDYLAEGGRYRGYGRDPDEWDATETAEMLEWLRQAYLDLLNPDPLAAGEDRHMWSFLRPTRSLQCWASIAADDSRTVTGVHLAGVTTVTANADAFYPTMEGADLYVTDLDALFLVIEYVSATQVKVVGNATCAGSTWSMTADGDYPLPDDYAGHFGEVTRARGASYDDIAVLGEGEIRRLRQRLDESGKIRVVAVRPMAGSSAAEGQRWELLVYPKPASAEELFYCSALAIDQLSEERPYPVGPQWFGGLLLDAYLAIIEQRKEHVEGPMTARYQRRLRAAIQEDKRSPSPETLGVMVGGVCRSRGRTRRYVGAVYEPMIWP